ncbi:hypothetical protein C8J56DRAFT_893388 [Mycena floridula]|nr:hypothetical protein C8J56DRAFT_893388 [Mycena floridula]
MANDTSRIQTVCALTRRVRRGFERDEAAAGRVLYGEAATDLRIRRRFNTRRHFSTKRAAPGLASGAAIGGAFVARWSEEATFRVRLGRVVKAADYRQDLATTTSFVNCSALKVQHLSKTCLRTKLFPAVSDDNPRILRAIRTTKLLYPGIVRCSFTLKVIIRGRMVNETSPCIFRKTSRMRRVRQDLNATRVLLGRGRSILTADLLRFRRHLNVFNTRGDLSTKRLWPALNAPSPGLPSSAAIFGAFVAKQGFRVRLGRVVTDYREDLAASREDFGYRQSATTSGDTPLFAAKYYSLQKPTSNVLEQVRMFNGHSPDDGHGGENK